VRINLPVLNVYKKRTTKSEIVTQLLYGDTFKKVKQFKSWVKIKNDLDNYKGYIENKKFPLNVKNTHKVSVLRSNLYLKPNLNSKINKKLSFSSRVRVSKRKGNFYKIDNFWIKKKDLKKINYKNKDIFSNIKKFKNIKYKWGGKHCGGIDCSALVQLFLNYNNRFCPRDAKDQIKYFKKKINIKKIRKNDLIFWKGHVAIIISKKKLIHAYGPYKKVVVMPVKNTIKRIFKTANLKVIGIRRL
tara:strand:+ start:2137 stop:2868 length:732 start_codon:yes stop_codon:yes gene_type:complete